MVCLYDLSTVPLCFLRPDCFLVSLKIISVYCTLHRLRAVCAATAGHLYKDITVLVMTFPCYGALEIFCAITIYLRNRRWGGCVYVLQSVFLYFFVFFPSTENIRQRDNRSRERLKNGFSWNFYQTIPGKKRHAAAWRMANVDDLRNLRWLWRNHQRAPRTAVAL